LPLNCKDKILKVTGIFVSSNDSLIAASIGVSVFRSPAIRESFEETKIPVTSKFYPLQFKGNVPVNAFAASKYWSKDLYVVPEHYFAV